MKNNRSTSFIAAQLLLKDGQCSNPTKPLHPQPVPTFGSHLSLRNAAVETLTSHAGVRNIEHVACAEETPTHAGIARVDMFLHLSVSIHVYATPRPPPKHNPETGVWGEAPPCLGESPRPDFREFRGFFEVRTLACA